jgi:hypothetical protein
MAAFVQVVVFLLLAACTSPAPPVIYGITQRLTVGSVTLTNECLFLSRDPVSGAVAQSAPEPPRDVAHSTCRPASKPWGASWLFRSRGPFGNPGRFS